MNKPLTIALSGIGALGLLGLAGCSHMPGAGPAPARMYSQDMLPDAVKVPAGHRVAWETVGVGEITYECRARPSSPMATEYEWVFVGPKATLNDRGGRMVGKYYGPPATWEAMDGSKLTATQLATAPAGSGNIPLQLVKANPAMGTGVLAGVTHIQRVDTRGGTAPAAACTAANAGAKSVVGYQADYIFYKAM